MTDQLLDWLASTLAADASGGEGVLPESITARTRSATIAGPALTVSVTTDDNSPMRDVPAAVTGPGTVLVVGGAADSRRAVMGDLVARSLLAAGIVAVVTDGPVRDSATIARLGLPVWSRGVTPIAPLKGGAGSVGGATRIGGLEVHDGDIVIADADGVVVWPSAEVAELLGRAESKQQVDAERAASFDS